MRNEALDLLPGSMGNAMENLYLASLGLNMVRNIQALGQGDECPDVRTPSGRTRAEPWTPPYPSPAELSDWYDVAEDILERAGGHKGMPAIDGHKKLAHLKLLYDALPMRIAAYALSPKEYILKAVKIAQAAMCLIHEAEFARLREEGTDPGIPRPAEKDDSSWWEGITDWFKLPRPGFTWPGLPELPSTADLFKWTMPPWWVLAIGGGVLLFIVSRHPAVKQARKAIE